MTTEPEDGVRYPLYIGDSFKKNNEEGKVFHTIQCKCVFSQDYYKKIQAHTKIYLFF
jgi:hypothetical protein